MSMLTRMHVEPGQLVWKRARKTEVVIAITCGIACRRQETWIPTVASTRIGSRICSCCCWKTCKDTMLVLCKKNLIDINSKMSFEKIISYTKIYLKQILERMLNIFTYAALMVFTFV